MVYPLPLAIVALAGDLVHEVEEGGPNVLRRIRLLDSGALEFQWEAPVDEEGGDNDEEGEDNVEEGGDDNEEGEPKMRQLTLYPTQDGIEVGPNMYSVHKEPIAVDPY